MQISSFLFCSLECGSQQGILSTQSEEMKFSETDAHKSGTDYYNSQRLLFNKHFAWCLLTKSLTDDPYKDWATIDLAGKYLIYGLQVCGIQQ